MTVMAVVIPTGQSPAAPAEAHPLLAWRRQKAREMLTANLQEAQLSGPMKCSRSLTEVNILDYKKHVRSIADPRLVSRHEEKSPRRMTFLKDVAAQREADESNKKHGASPEKLRNTRIKCLNAPKTEPPRAVVVKKKVKPETKGFTISEIHRLMKDCQTSGGDQISISIRRVSSAHPGVHLTVQGALQQHNKGKDQKLHPNTRVTGRKINRSDALLLKSFVPRKRKTSSSGSLTDSLKTLDSCEMGPMEKTRQWLFDNPIGDVMASDVDPFDDVIEVDTALPVADGYAISSTTESRSVRFGYDRIIKSGGRNIKLRGRVSRTENFDT